MSNKTYPKFLITSNSLLAKNLTKEVFEQLKNKKTKRAVTLNDIIKSGVKNSDSGIGAYAGDEESYKTFAPLFDKIIADYHGYSKTDMHKSNLNSNDLKVKNIDPDNKYIISTRIRVGRNIKEYPLGATITKQQRNAIEKQVSLVLKSLQGELAGNYYPLSNLTPKTRKNLISNHFLFKADDRFLEAAGLTRDWPNGRGIYHNTNKTFLVWINEEDQLRIISMQKGGAINTVFKRLVTALEIMQQKIAFSYDDHLGYIASCPSNLGTSLRASVHIKLPNLSKNKDAFKAIADAFHVQIRGVDGEHSKNKNNIFDISNKRRLGITEVQCIQDMYNGVVALIKKEQELA